MSDVTRKKINKKHLLLLFIATLFFVLGMEFLKDRYTLAFTMKGHQCLPYKFWVIQKGVEVKKNDFIAFKGKGIPNFPDDITWVKIFYAGEGDRIEVIDLPTPVEKTIEVNNMPKKYEISAVARIIREDGVVTLDIFSYDTDGKKLPKIGNQVLGKNDIFVYATHERSFDSRYWGVIKKEQVIGKAVPII